MDAKRTIVVTGATGNQGGATARHLLDDGWPIRIFVRDPTKPSAVEFAAAGAEVCVGNFEDPASLAHAFEDAYGVYSVQTWRGPGGVEAEVAAGVAVAEAAAAAGVSHLVYSSVGGADRAPELTHFVSKLRIEQRIAELGIPATVLRPTLFMDNFKWQADGIRAGRLVQGVRPTTRLQMIAVDDIGGLAARAFGAPEDWIGTTIEIAGDELTMPEVAAIFARRVGHEVEYVSTEDNRPGDREESRRMTAWFETDGYRADIPALRALHPPLKDFQTYVDEADWLGPRA
jgi:uncharacterized protein YbjT (DUF2867 family)